MESLEVSKRFKTLPLEQIDAEALGLEITSNWQKYNDYRQDFLQQREDWTNNWRNLRPEQVNGMWDNSSNFHIPLTLLYGKAIHARLWQLFADPSFFGVEARRETFIDREPAVREFMQFLLDTYSNGKKGTRNVFDEWLWDVVFEGSSYLKLWWNREVHKYTEVEPVVTATEKTVYAEGDLTGRTEYETTVKEELVVKEDVLETPYIGTIALEDILLPPGQSDPQTSRWVKHRVEMQDYDLKYKAKEGKFDKEQVEKALQHKSSHYDDNNTQAKQKRDELDGYVDPDGYSGSVHFVIEYYGKAYVKKKIDGQESYEINELPEEVVIWVHQASGLVLGWTYLHTISPNGRRPIFSGDFIKFSRRTHQVGVPEVIAPIQQGINSVYNLRQDNGVLASTPLGFYRSSSGLKPDKIRMQPGTFNPVDDPNNDVRVLQIPYLANFGNNEEDRLMSYAERVLTISDLQLGRTPDKVGVFRTASGSQGFQQESGIQLEIHFDRLARTLSDLLSCMFTLARERVPEQLFYRVTGENGEPIFGKVSREALKGQYDFKINIDILGESRNEAQQKAVMMMQMLINPAFSQTGVVTPDNLYHMARNFLIKNRVRRVNNYVTPPPQYQGEVIAPEERIFRIVLNNFMEPPIEETVRMNENHMKALQIIDGFKQSDHYGMLTSPEQIAALERLAAKHMQFTQAIQAGSNPNMTGMQTPREGFAPMEGAAPSAPAPSQGTLGSPQGEANGPVV